MNDNEPNKYQIYAAAIQWCSIKERETFSTDIEYFNNNWMSLPGLRSLVEAQYNKAQEYAKA
jgi:hypothetical protein